MKILLLLFTLVAALGVIALLLLRHGRGRLPVVTRPGLRHPDESEGWQERHDFAFAGRHRLVAAPPTIHEKARRPMRDRRGDYGLPWIEDMKGLVRFLELKNYAELVWLADPNLLQSQHHVRRGLRNYHVRRIPKRGGGKRVIHAPKTRLKKVQRLILRGILDKVPVHPSATAFRRDSDVRRHAARHAGQALVFTADLRDFFPSIPLRRVVALFLWLGYPPKVAHVLGLLCTTRDVGFTSADAARYGPRHLPQGAPTSPHLSNLICWSLDRRLEALAKRFGASYTRYADDLAFSDGEDFKRGFARFLPRLRKVVAQEGLHLHEGKLRVLRGGQQQRITGLVVNRKPQVAREEYDRLRAILHNARRAGSLESQNHDGHKNFAAHLRGRIGWVAAGNASRGRKLERMWRAAVAASPGGS